MRRIAEFSAPRRSIPLPSTVQRARTRKVSRRVPAVHLLAPYEVQSNPEWDFAR